MDFSESEEHALLRDAVAKVARGFGHEYFQEKARTDGRTDELWDALGELGFLGVHLPEAYGGGGGGISELAIVCEEVAAAGCPLLLILVSAAICAEVINRFGTEDQKQAWLPGLAGSEKMVFAITEPDAGSNSHNVSTTARRDGDVYRVNGTKTYISGVDEAPRVLTVVRTGTDASTGHAELSLLVIDTDAPGLERQLIPVEIKAPEKQFTLFFDDVQVPADRLVGEEGDGLRQVFFGLNPERITGATIANGMARYALDRAASYARDRQVWGVPIGSHQGVAHPLAQAKIEVELARLMTAKAAWATDAGVPGAGEAANMAKYAAAEAALHAVDVAIQIHGGNGFAAEYGIAGLWWMARVLRTAPVSREMILNYVAEHSLRLPRSY
jgi:alkylation response protein AidB-like acyl-CoA dehydrogenase